MEMILERVIKLLLTIIPLLLTGCVTPYNIDYSIPEKEIVVDGLITDQPGPYEVKLSYTSAYTNNVEGANYPVSGAAIVIEDDSGHAEMLTEINSGVYLTAENGIRGKIGNSYTLKITLLDGSIIESYPEKLTSTPPIDSVYYEFVPVAPNQIQGHQVYIAVSDPAGENNYYRWKWSGYYTFTVSNGMVTHECIKNEFDLKEINVFSDRYINGNSFRQPIHLIPHFGNVYYLIQVFQQSLTEDAYKFWNKAYEQGTQMGSIFDRIPSKILGNCYYSDRRQEDVYGYFGASAILQKNLMMKFSPGTIPLYPRTYIFQPCTSFPHTDEFDASYPDTWPDGWEF